VSFDKGNRFSSPYQSSFKPNRTCRDVVAVLEMTPAVPDNPVGFLAVGGEDDKVRSIEIGTIKQIKEFGAKLQAQPLMKSYVFQN
jgi:hypothetical protein